MIRWLLIAVAVVVLYKLVIHDRGRKKQDGNQEQERKVAAGELVKDPMCGTYVDVDSSITVRDGSTVHRFCSYDCRQKFLEQLQSSGREIPALDKDEAN